MSIPTTPSKVFFDEDTKVIFVCHGELLTLEILRSTAEKINQILGLKPGYGSFVDFRQCKEICLSDSEIHAMNIFVKNEMAWRGEFSLAFVASSPLMYGLSRMYGSILDGTGAKANVFRNVEPALEWVGLPGDYKLPY